MKISRNDGCRFETRDVIKTRVLDAEIKQIVPFLRRKRFKLVVLEGKMGLEQGGLGMRPLKSISGAEKNDQRIDFVNVRHKSRIKALYLSKFSMVN